MVGREDEDDAMGVAARACSGAGLVGRLAGRRIGSITRGIDGGIRCVGRGASTRVGAGTGCALSAASNVLLMIVHSGKED